MQVSAGHPRSPERGRSAFAALRAFASSCPGWWPGIRDRPEAAEELELLKRLDRIFTDYPVYGSRKRHPEHKVYPSLLRGKTIDQPNQVCGQLT